MDFLKNAAEKATGGSEHKQENNQQNDDYVDKGRWCGLFHLIMLYISTVVDMD